MAPQHAALPAHMGAHIGASRHACIQGDSLQPNQLAQVSLYPPLRMLAVFLKRIQHAYVSSSNGDTAMLSTTHQVCQVCQIHGAKTLEECRLCCILSLGRQQRAFWHGPG